MGFHMNRVLTLAVVLLTASVCLADPSEKPWQATVGAEHVMTFASAHVPMLTSYHYAYAVADRPGEVFVAMASAHDRFGPRELFRPPGRPVGKYAFALDTRSGKVDFVPWEELKRMALVEERRFGKMPRDFPDLGYGGAPVDYLDCVVRWREGEPVVAALSFDQRGKERTTIGLPSLIPFMGRQKLVQKETRHSGTMFLEIFDTDHPAKPLVQMTKRFRNYPSPPDIRDVAVWVEGADRPTLVTVDRGDPAYGVKGVFSVIRPPWPPAR